MQNVNLLIKSPIEAKVGQTSQKPYYRVETSMGWFTLFDHGMASVLAPYVGQMVNCDIEIKDNPQSPGKPFKHIKAVIGPGTGIETPMQQPAPAIPQPMQIPQVPGIVQAPMPMMPAQVQVPERNKAYDKDPNGLAVEIFCAIYPVASDKTAMTNLAIMTDAINLVKQAQDAFK